MTTEETSLQQRLEAVGDILTSGDAERIGGLYTQGGQLLPPGSDFVTGREAVAEFWIGATETGVETIDIEPMEVETHENTAWRVGTATLADPDGATIDHVKFIEIWNRDDGEWRIHRDIWNSNTTDEQ